MHLNEIKVYMPIEFFLKKFNFLDPFVDEGKNAEFWDLQAL